MIFFLFCAGSASGAGRRIDKRKLVALSDDECYQPAGFRLVDPESQEPGLLFAARDANPDGAVVAVPRFATEPPS